MSIPIGQKGSARTTVTAQLTADAAGSGTLSVFGTPAMSALMEQAAHTSIAPYLEPGQTSVGVAMDLTHTSATPVGMEVRAESEVTRVDGRTVTFSVRAFDDAGPIGQGTHQRVLVDAARFLSRTQEKKGGQPDVH